MIAAIPSVVPTPVQAVRKRPEAAEVKGAPDHDGDADDGSAAKVTTASAVGTAGQSQ